MKNIDNAGKPLGKAIEGLAVPVATSIGKTLSDIWDIVFGNIGLIADIKRAKLAQSLEEFKLDLSRKVANIPKENLIEPKLRIVGPALECSKYFFEEAELREMFANLIAKSMDDRFVSNIHPCFSQIITQLTPVDASNLQCFDKHTLPLAEYRLALKDRGYHTAMRNIFLSNPDARYIINQAESISSLVRLGLVVIEPGQFVSDFDYTAFIEVAPFSDLIEMAEKDEKYKYAYCVRQSVSLTPLGIAFKLICLPSDPEFV